MKEVESITVDELDKLAGSMYGNLIKGVVDVRKSALVLDMEMHVDGEQYFLENGSSQTDLWGINLYPAKYGSEEFVEFDSMINIRPRQENMSRSVENPDIRDEIIQIVGKIVHK